MRLSRDNEAAWPKTPQHVTVTTPFVIGAPSAVNGAQKRCELGLHLRLEQTVFIPLDQPYTIVQVHKPRTRRHTSGFWILSSIAAAKLASLPLRKRCLPAQLFSCSYHLPLSWLARLDLSICQADGWDARWVSLKALPMQCQGCLGHVCFWLLAAFAVVQVLAVWANFRVIQAELSIR